MLKIFLKFGKLSRSFLIFVCPLGEKVPADLAVMTKAYSSQDCRRIFVYCTKHAFNSDLLAILINALVFCKLIYRLAVWSNTSDRNIRKLQHIQNFAARIISGARKFNHISPVLRKLCWLPVRNQLYLRDAVSVFKCMAGCVPDYRHIQASYHPSCVERNSQQ